MTLSLLIVALGLGLAGSLHCAGMCGPLLLSLSLIKKNRGKLFRELFVHHAGRIFAYAVLGLIAGTMGQAMASGGMQQKLSIIAGVLLLILLVIPHMMKGKSKFSVFLKKKWGQLINKSGFKNSFLIGTVNGLLPCGLVYAALASAAATGSIISGALFMVIFGIGTLPLLLVISVGGLKLNLSTKKLSSYVLPAATIITASLLILRGMNLGIPYVSPTYEADSQEISCGCEDDS